MRIVLEGCDGTGKSTLAQILSYKYNLDICHCGRTDPSDYDFYKNSIRKDNVVWDRHVIGELIYPEIFGRDGRIDAESARLVVCYGREVNTKFIILTCDSHVIGDRLNARGTEDSRILDNYVEINRKFLHYADLFDIPVIDTTKLTLSEIFNLVEAEVKYHKFVHK